jgi:hypothetical protein
LPLYKGHSVIESVVIGIFRVAHKPKVEVHPGHKLMGPEKEEEGKLVQILAFLTKKFIHY